MATSEMKLRVLHVLDHSLPVPSGYSVRSHAIISEQVQRGWDVSVVTGPKQEGDRTAKFSLDGVNYQRVWPRSERQSSSGMRRQIADVFDLRHGLRAEIARISPDVLHVHSPCLNALSAFGLGVPVVYEMRSSWEDAAVSSGTTTEGSLRYRLSRGLESLVLQRATCVTTICEGLKTDIVSRGVPHSRVTVVPNAVDSRTMDSRLPDRMTARARFGVGESTVLGFIGSLFAWEGLETAIRSLPVLASKGIDARLLIVGDGPARSGLESLAKQLNVTSAVRFTGQVPRDAVHDAYAAVDFMVFPRLPMRLTDMVTPIKPLEAMALRKPVIASDVGGHRELVVDRSTGLLFAAGSHDAMAAVVASAIADPASVDRLVQSGRDFIAAERTWKQSVVRYAAVYAEAASGRASP